MDRKKYLSKLAGAQITKNAWCLIAVVSIISNLFLSIGLSTADTSEKTIVTPLDFKKPFIVKGDNVDSSYIEQMSKLFLNELLTYQKKTARVQFDNVLSYVHPSVYSFLSTKYDLDYERIKNNDISSVFYFQGVEVKGNTSYVTGVQKGWIGSKLIDDSVKTFELVFEYSNGRLSLIGSNEVRKNESGFYERVSQDDVLMIGTRDTSISGFNDVKKELLIENN